MKRRPSIGRSGLPRLGWMHLLLVAVIAASFAVPMPATAQTGTVVGTDRVNIRACASLDCPVIGAATLGEQIEITGAVTNGFYPVRWFDQDGYVAARYISQGGPAPWFVEGDVSCAEVAITFNIGIGDPPSQTVLDTLLQKQVPATMFPMGWWAAAAPDYLRALDEAGFVIGTHGDQNLFLTDTSDARIRQDIADSVAAIEAVIGRPIDRYHTPYAADTDDRVRRIVAEEGFLPVGWKVAAGDYATWATEADVYARVMNRVYPGAVIEFHLDGPATETSTARALPRIIDDLRGRGFDLVTVPDLMDGCLGLPSAQDGATATVVNTGGAGLNCRVAPTTAASRLTTLAAGSTATVRGDSFAGWVPLRCGGQDGWSSATYLSIATAEPDPEPPPAETRTGTVVNTGGAGLNCRSGPATTRSVITVLAAGASVPVRGDQQGDWWPVSCGGQDGWVYSSYLRVTSNGPAPSPTPVPSPTPTEPPSEPTPDPTPSPTPTPSPDPDPVTTGTVSNTGGAGLNCRTGPSTGNSVITVLAAGAAVPVRGATEGGWVPVVCGGQDGWVSATYLTIAGSGPSDGTGVVTTGGARAYCRAAPSLSGTIITSLANGTEVAVRGAPSGDWVPIRCANRDGWIYDELIRVN